jgi:hypothetical protein
MITNKTVIKDLPKNIKLSTINSDDEDIFLCEYTLATLIYNGATFNQLLEFVNEIEDKIEREQIKQITISMVLNIINFNPEFAHILKREDNRKFSNFLDIDFTI